MIVADYPVPARPLTTPQRETLDVIRRSVETNGYPPTIRELAAHFGISRNGVNCRLHGLQAKGAICVENERARGIRIVGVRWRMEVEKRFRRGGRAREMSIAPLWQRALTERAVERERAKRVRHGEACRNVGYANRVHPRPKVGDLYAGTWRVEAALGPGRRGRADLSFFIKCVKCGRFADVFEFNLRKRQPCMHGERPARIVTSSRCSACVAESGGKAKPRTRIAVRDGLCAVHLSRRDASSTCGRAG